MAIFTMKTIVVQSKKYGNKEAFVSERDFDFLNKDKWYLSGGYAISGKEGKRMKMHRLILNPEKHELIDHIDRNKLNNTRENLRIVDRDRNVHNQQKRTNTKNNYKGTNYVKRLGLWQSRCRIFGNDFYLGLYKSEIAAAYAYNKKAIELSDCAFINKLPFPVDVLEAMLISDLKQLPKAENQSEYKGVGWHKQGGRAKRGKWQATIRFDGKRISLGRFDDEIEAAKAYDKKALELYGEFANLNFKNT